MSRLQVLIRYELMSTGPKTREATVSNSPIEVSGAPKNVNRIIDKQIDLFKPFFSSLGTKLKEATATAKGLSEISDFLSCRLFCNLKVIPMP